jgi:2-iminobutanoate/2-iminopropanoate deaminase
MREAISTPDAPRSPLYSQGIKAGHHVYVSGMAGIDARTGQPPGPTIQEQTRQSLANCEAVLKAAGASLSDVVEVGVLLADPNDFAGMNEEWAAWFPADAPSRSVAKLGAVIPGVLISIRMTAALD